MGLDSSFGLGFTFVVKDAATDTLKRLESQLEHTKTTGEKAAHGFTDAWAATKDLARSMIAPGVGLIAGTFAAAKASGDFSAVIQRVGLISRATTADLQSLRAAAIQAGIDTQWSPTEAAEGLKVLSSQGLQAKDAITALGGALNLATGGGIQVEQAAVAMTASMKVFGLAADQASTIADKLLHIGHITHFEPKELEIAMGTIGRGAGLTKQPLDEMLISMGLVRNTGVDMSVAASSVSAALIHMGQNASHFKAIGVSVTDAKGQFRPFLDVVGEASVALEKKFPNAAKRVEVAEKLFARFGLTAYSAIGGQLAKGVHDAEGHVYRGAAAIQYLRHEMEKAAGTGQKFTDAVNAGFKGSVKQWHGSVETLSILAGEGFEQVYTPIIQGGTTALNHIVGFLDRLSPSAKKLAAQIVIGAGAVIAFTGAGVGLIAILKLIGPLMISSFATFATAMLPVTLVLGTLGLLGAGAYVAMRKNLGGLGDVMADMGRKTKLAVSALAQLFSRGWMDEATGKEITKDENSGVLGFVKRVYGFVENLKSFLGGVWDGFVARVEQAAPHFGRLADAFEKFSNALGMGTAKTAAENAAGFDKMAEAGTRVGNVLGTVADIGAITLAVPLETLAGFVTQLRKDWPELKTTFFSVDDSLRTITSSVNEVREALGITDKKTRESSGWWESFGGIVGKVVVGLGRTIRQVTTPFVLFFSAIHGAVVAVIDIVASLWDAFAGLSQFFVGAFSMNWEMTWKGLARVAFGVMGFIVRVVMTMGEAIGGIIDALGRTVGKDFGIKRSIQGTKKNVLASLATGLGVGEVATPYSGLSTSHGGAAGPGGIMSEGAPEGEMSYESPLASMPPSGSQESSESTNALLQQQVDLLEKLTAAPPAPITVVLDRQKVGEANQSYRRDETFSSYGPGMDLVSE